MPPKKDIKQPKDLFKENDPGKSSMAEIVVLQSQIQDLQTEVDILKNTIDVLKTDPGADMGRLKNQEQAAIVDALKTKYPLSALLTRLEFPRSSYYYQRKRQTNPCKYASLQATIITIFQTNNNCYGYR